MARAFLARKAQATLQARLHLAERYGRKIQAQCRGLLVRSHLQQARQQHTDVTPRVIAIQAAAQYDPLCPLFTVAPTRAFTRSVTLQPKRRMASMMS